MSVRPYAEVIGDPIAHSKSPLIHNFWLAKLGIDGEYRACHVRVDELQSYLHSRNLDDKWRGCNVTMPHKQAVIPLLDRLEAVTAEMGAVNTITMADCCLVGCNTDASGFLEPLQPLLAGCDHRFAYVVGAGGAARGIFHALQLEGFRIWSFSRNPDRTAIEFERYVNDEFVCGMDYLTFDNSKAVRISSDSDRLDLFVNASSLGMKDHDDLLVKLERFPEELVVYDIITAPPRTALLQQAESLGLRTIDGLAMLIGQAALAFEKFFGQPAPREFDAELRALLTAE